MQILSGKKGMFVGLIVGVFIALIVLNAVYGFYQPASTQQEAKYVYISGKVWTLQSHSAVSGAAVYMFDENMEIVDIDTTDSDGTWQSSIQFEVGDVLYLWVRPGDMLSSDPYPSQLVKIVVPDGPSGEVVSVKTIALMDRSNTAPTISTDDTAISSNTLNVTQYSTRTSITLKITGLDSNTYFGSYDQIDYGLPDHPEYRGCVFVVKWTPNDASSNVAPEVDNIKIGNSTDSYSMTLLSSFSRGNVYYWVYQFKPIHNWSGTDDDDEWSVVIHFADSISSSNLGSLEINMYDLTEAEDIPLGIFDGGLDVTALTITITS